MKASWNNNLPQGKGSYILNFAITTPLSLSIGKLGYHKLQPGIYHYCGSARGSGGVRARLRHHLTTSSAPHWHLDFLRPHIQYLTAIFTLTIDPLECQFSQILRDHPGADIPVPGFGASDCRCGCAAHLVLVPITTEEIVVILQKRLELGIRYNWVILDNLEVT